MSLVASAMPKPGRPAVRAVAGGRAISAASSEIRVPGRSTQARTLTGATGIAPRMSSVSRPMRSATAGGVFLDELRHQRQRGEPC